MIQRSLFTPEQAFQRARQVGTSTFDDRDAGDGEAAQHELHSSLAAGLEKRALSSARAAARAGA